MTAPLVLPFVDHEVPMPRVTAVMSVPRLGFMDHFFCALGILPRFGIGVRKTTGAFWGQCMERALEQALEEGVEFILTMDYDTVFTEKQLERLLALAVAHDLDALAPVQVGRKRSTPLFTLKDEHGQVLSQVGREHFAGELVRAATAHFGLTLIKASALRKLPKPWFVGVPDADGRWGETRIDDDVHFWKQWEACGNALHIAARVPVGHAELMVRWPDINFDVVHQHPSAFWEHGLPAEVWK